MIVEYFVTDLILILLWGPPFGLSWLEDFLESSNLICTPKCVFKDTAHLLHQEELKCELDHSRYNQKLKKDLPALWTWYSTEYLHLHGLMHCSRVSKARDYNISLLRRRLYFGSDLRKSIGGHQDSSILLEKAGFLWSLSFTNFWYNVLELLLYNMISFSRVGPIQHRRMGHRIRAKWFCPLHTIIILFVLFFKVVLGGYHRIFFRVKVKTVNLIGGRRYLAVRSGLYMPAQIIQMMAFT